MAFDSSYEYVENMRLTSFEVESIIKAFKTYYMPTDRLWVFGSRVDMQEKGGDIDLYIETSLKAYDDILQKRRDFLIMLTDAIGDQKIDVVTNTCDGHNLPIYDVAKRDGVRLV